MSSIQLPSRDRIALWAMGAIGVASLATIFFTDDALHTRFWSSLLHNGTYFTFIALMAIFFVCVSRTALAGWNVGFKRVWEAMAMFMVVGFGVMALISVGIYAGWHHLFHWADPEAVAGDKILQGKSGFLNKHFFTIGGLGILGLWIFFAHKMRTLSIAEDNHGDDRYLYYKKMKFWAAVFLPIAGFGSAVVIWLWNMSVDPHWYSTLYAWYTGSSAFVAMIALTILLLLYLKSRGYYHNVTPEHFHDLGKFMFAFTIFWTYLWFSQYMLIWYGNIGEETVYFQTRIQKYPVLFYGNLIINFVFPFLILMRNDTKRKFGTLFVVSLIVFFGHWVDTFQMLKPGVLEAAQEHLSTAHHIPEGLSLNAPEVSAQIVASHAEGTSSAVSHGEDAAHGHADMKPDIGYFVPGPADIGLMLGFLALFVATTLYFLSKAPLVPKNDPYLQESYHHHV